MIYDDEIPEEFRYLIPKHTHESHHIGPVVYPPCPGCDWLSALEGQTRVEELRLKVQDYQDSVRLMKLGGLDRFEQLDALLREVLANVEYLGQSGPTLMPELVARLRAALPPNVGQTPPGDDR